MKAWVRSRVGSFKCMERAFWPVVSVKSRVECDGVQSPRGGVAGCARAHMVEMIDNPPNCSGKPIVREGRHMLVGSAVRRVAIIGGVRIPFARAHGAYAKASNQDMLTAALRGVVDRFNLAGV